MLCVSVLQIQSTPLMIAAQEGHVNVVDVLLQQNANVNYMDAVSHTY